MEPLRAQSEKAKKFLILRDELRGLEISLWLEQLERLILQVVVAHNGVVDVFIDAEC